MGRKLILTGTKLTDLSAPKLAEIDQIESAGSLALIEPMHPAMQWAAGVPTTGTVVNILGANAQGLVGGTLAESDITVSTDGSAYNNGVRGKVERSAKGGVHAIYANADATNVASGGSWYEYRQGAKAVAYIVANNTHNFYQSLWMRTTKNPPAGKQVNAVFNLSKQLSSTSAYYFFASQMGINVKSGVGGKKFEDRWGSTYPLGPKFNAVASPYEGTPPATTGEVLQYLFQIGARGTINSFSNAKEAPPSAVFYRAYFEDLTVSGRTFEQVQAIDHALYTKEVLTVGGRYYNDTITTDPTTLP